MKRNENKQRFNFNTGLSINKSVKKTLRSYQSEALPAIMQEINDSDLDIAFTELNPLLLRHTNNNEKGEGEEGSSKDIAGFIKHRLFSTPLTQKLHLFKYDALKPIPERRGVNRYVKLGRLMNEADVDLLMKDIDDANQDQAQEEEIEVPTDEGEDSDDDGFGESLDDAMFNELLDKRDTGVKAAQVPKNQTKEEKQGREEEESKAKREVELQEVCLSIQESNIVINNGEQTINIGFKIRNSAVLKCPNNSPTTTHQEEETQEDTLILCTTTGITLLASLYADPDDEEGEKVKLYITQYWKPQLHHDRHSHISSAQLKPKPTDPGHQIIPYHSGELVLISSLYDTYRLHWLKTDKQTGLKRLSGHIETYTDGMNIHSCFITPDLGLDFLVNLILTSERRLLLKITQIEREAEGFGEVKLGQSNQLLLNTSFEIPVFICELAGYICLLYEGRITLISFHQVISCELSFQEFKIEGLGFPVSWYKPTSRIMSSLENDKDELLIVTEDGRLYSIVMNEKGDVRWYWVLRCLMAEQFILERNPAIQIVNEREEEDDDDDDDDGLEITARDDGFTLYVSSPFAPSYKIHHPSITPMQINDKNNKQKDKARPTTLSKTCPWTPLTSLITIPSTTSRDLLEGEEEELWAAHSRGVSRLRHGIPLITELKMKMRGTGEFNNMFVHFNYFNDQLCFILSGVEGTQVLLYDGEQGQIIGLEDDNIGLDLNHMTVFMTSFENWCFQVTMNGICVTDPFDSTTGAITLTFSDYTAVLADAFEDLICVASEQQGDLLGMECYLRWFKVSDDVRAYGSVIKVPNTGQCLRFVKFEDLLLLLVAVDDSIDVYKDHSDGFKFMKRVNLNGLEDGDIVHDVLANDGKVYVTTRYGKLQILRLLNWDFDVELSQSLQICSTPILLTLSPENHILLKSHTKLYRLNTNTASIHSYPIPLLPFSDSPKSSSSSKKPLLKATQITTSKYALLTSDSLTVQSFSRSHITSVSQEQPHQHCSPPIKTPTPPTSLTYLSSFGLFLTTHTNQINLLSRSRGVKLSYKVLTKDKKKRFLKRDETPLCCAEWLVYNAEGKRYKNLLLGTRIDSTGSGTLKLIQVVGANGNADRDKSLDKSHDLTLIVTHSIKTPGPVSKVIQLGAYQILLVCGGVIGVIGYEPVQRNFKPLKVLYEFRDIITDLKLSTSDDGDADDGMKKVLVTVNGMGVREFKIEVDDDGSIISLSQCYADNFLLTATQCLRLADDFIISADGVDQSLSLRQTNNIDFKMSIPGINYTPRLLAMVKLLPPWYRRFDSMSVEGRRFVSYGLNGEVELYTALTSSQLQTLNMIRDRYLQRGREEDDGEVLIMERDEVSRVGVWNIEGKIECEGDDGHIQNNREHDVVVLACDELLGGLDIEENHKMLIERLQNSVCV